MVVLKSMMPPIEGAEKVRGPPPEATLEKSELVWSEHDPRHGGQRGKRNACCEWVGICHGLWRVWWEWVDLVDQGH